MRLGHARRPIPADVFDGLARNVPSLGPADLVGTQKYGFDEARPILERASARETEAGVVRSYLEETAGIEVVAHIVELAVAKAPYGVYPQPSTSNGRSSLPSDASRVVGAVTVSSLH